MPESERSFAGYTFHQRLSVGFYGTVYRAVGGNHQEARILQIDPALSARSGFVAALERFGSDLGLLEHKNVQATILVGKTPAEQHVVVNEATPNALTLEQLLKDASAAGASLSPAVALAVGRAVVSGLTHAHSVGIVHGAVHPRSVLVDYHGGVKLADFAAARALAVAATDADDPQALQMKGYLAPELALGDAPTVATDVYAAGALLHMLLSGMPPPGGRLRGPAELDAAIGRALATAPEDRFPSAIELRAALREAVERGGAAVASVKDLAAFVSQLRGAAEASLDQETEDVLASLASDFAAEEAPPAPAARRSRAASVRAPSDPSLEDALDELVAGLPVKGQTPPPERIATNDIVDEEDDDERPTAVDAMSQITSDPVSAIIRADRGLTGEPLVRLGSEHDDEDTYIPPALTDSDVELASAARRAVRRASSEPRISKDAALKRESAKRRSIRPASGTDPVAPMMEPKRGGGGLWILTLVIIGAVGGVFLYMKDKDRPEPTTTVTKVGEGVKAGDITISANEPDAAVWLKLGPTPVDTMPLSAADVHQIRVEHEGYGPADINVLGSMWSGSGNQMRAVLSAKLEQAAPGEVGKAYPPAPQRPKTGREGRGVLRITSTPSGANAYLLVGFTPDVMLHDVRAGQEYEFKVAKDGFTPGFVVIRAEEWKQGDGWKRSVERTAELLPLPPDKHKKK